MHCLQNLWFLNEHESSKITKSHRKKVLNCKPWTNIINQYRCFGIFLMKVHIFSVRSFDDTFLSVSVCVCVCYICRPEDVLFSVLCSLNFLSSSRKLYCLFFNISLFSILILNILVIVELPTNIGIVSIWTFSIWCRGSFWYLRKRLK